MVNILEEVKQMSEEQLTELVYAIKDRRDYLNSENLEGFRIGDRVTWTKGQSIYKETYKGEVYKINPKTVAVREDGRSWVKWRISPSMLTKLEDEE